MNDQVKDNEDRIQQSQAFVNQKCIRMFVDICSHLQWLRKAPGEYCSAENFIFILATFENVGNFYTLHELSVNPTENFCYTTHLAAIQS